MFDSDKKTSKVALLAFWLAVAGIGLECMYVALIVVGADVGHLVIAAMLTLLAAFGCGLLSLLHIAICHRGTKGLGYALVALLLSFPMVWLYLGISSHVKTRQLVKQAHSGSYNLRVLGAAIKKYAADHGDRLPLAEQWCDVLLESDPSLRRSNFQHPDPEPFGLTGEYHFAFNSRLSGAKFSEVNPKTVLLFEADGQWNHAGTGELLAEREAEYNSVYTIFVDGTMERYLYDVKGYRTVENKQLEVRKLRWAP